MSENQDQPAPQHALKEAVIPVRLDLTEATRQIDAMERRLSEMKAPVGIGQGIGGGVPQAISGGSQIGSTEVLSRLLITTNQLLESIKAQMEDLTLALERQQPTQ